MTDRELLKLINGIANEYNAAAANVMIQMLTSAAGCHWPIFTDEGGGATRDPFMRAIVELSTDAARR